MRLKILAIATALLVLVAAPAHAFSKNDAADCSQLANPTASSQHVHGF